MRPFPEHPNYQDVEFIPGFELAPAASPKAWVILFHGLTGSPAEMQSLAKALVDLGYLVVAPQLCGHNGNFEDLIFTKSSEWLKQTDELVANLQKRFPELPSFFVGLSFGSLLALHAAGSRGSKTSGLALISPPYRLRSSTKEYALRALSYLPDLLINHLPMIRKTERPLDYLPVKHHAYAAHSVAALSRLFQIRRKLKQSRNKPGCPVLLLHDPKDHHLAADLAQYLPLYVDSRACSEASFPDGQHELLIGPQQQTVKDAIINFMEKLCNAS